MTVFFQNFDAIYLYYTLYLLGHQIWSFLFSEVIKKIFLYKRYTLIV